MGKPWELRKKKLHSCPPGVSPSSLSSEIQKEAVVSRSLLTCAPCSIWRLCSESLGGQVNSCCWAPFCSKSGCNSEQELQETAYVLCCRSPLLASFLYSAFLRLTSPAFVCLVIVKTGICLRKSPWEHQLLQLDKSCTG